MSKTNADDSHNVENIMSIEKQTFKTTCWKNILVQKTYEANIEFIKNYNIKFSLGPHLELSFINHYFFKLVSQTSLNLVNG